MRYLIFALLSFLLPNAFADESVYASKITLRTGLGQYDNQGTMGGSTVSVGGVDLQYSQFVSANFALGLGYVAQFDLTGGGVPISGLEFFAKSYFWGQGTDIRGERPWGSFISYKDKSAYVSLLYGMRKFYLGEDVESSDPTKKLAGEYSVINVGAGMDYRLSERWELNAEGNFSLISLTGSDARIKISEMIVWFGVGYIF